MKKNIFLKFIGTVICYMVPFFCAAQSIDDFNLIYKIKYQDETQTNCLNISVDFKKNTTGQYILRLPPRLQELQIAPSNFSYEAVKDQIYKFSIPSDKNLSVNYNICSQNPTRYITSSIVEKDFVYILPWELFLIPENDLETPLKIKFDLSGMPENFHWLTNFNADAKEFEGTLTMAEWNETIITGGAIDIKKASSHGHPVYILMKGNLAPFEQKIIHGIEQLINEQRKFWNEFNYPHYAIVLIQQNSANNDLYITGTHKKNLLIMSHSEITEKRLTPLFYSLSHELFHNWLGINLKIPLPQGNLQWLFEGVNDYYGLYFSYKSGIINESNYIKLVNTIFEQYYLSPFKLFSNKEIAKSFKINNPIAKLAESRTHLTFLNYFSQSFDEIKNSSSVQSPLDNAVKELYKKYINNPNSLTEDIVDNIFEKHFGSQPWKNLKSYIIGGRYIEPSPTLFTHYALLTNSKTSVPDFGFNLYSCLVENKIKSLSPNSNAYKAGLREGHHVHANLLNLVNPNGINKLLIKEKDQLKEIEFIPNKLDERIPEYILFNAEK